MRRFALEHYRHEYISWALLAPHQARGSTNKPPKLPDILKERRRG